MKISSEVQAMEYITNKWKYKISIYEFEIHEIVVKDQLLPALKTRIVVLRFKHIEMTFKLYACTRTIDAGAMSNDPITMDLHSPDSSKNVRGPIGRKSRATR